MPLLRPAHRPSSPRHDAEVLFEKYLCFSVIVDRVHRCKGQPDLVGLGARMKQPRELLSIFQLLRPIADQFVSTIERHIEHESRLFAKRLLISVRSARNGDSARASQPESESANTKAQRPRENASGGRARVMRRDRRSDGQKNAAVWPDPLQAERTAELDLLRRILRPVSETPITQPPSGRPPLAGATSTDPARLLENEIRDAIAFLSALPSERCAAQIAVWAGRARIHQAHPNDGRTRFAAGLLLRKLRGLAQAMDVGSIDALTPGYEWDWARYIALNEAITAGSGGNGTKGDATERARDGADEFSAVWE
jgi:hypothetical protein